MLATVASNPFTDLTKIYRSYCHLCSVQLNINRIFLRRELIVCATVRMKIIAQCNWCTEIITQYNWKVLIRAATRLTSGFTCLSNDDVLLISDISDNAHLLQFLSQCWTSRQSLSQKSCFENGTIEIIWNGNVQLFIGLLHDGPHFAVPKFPLRHPGTSTVTCRSTSIAAGKNGLTRRCTYFTFTLLLRELEMW